MAAEETLPSQDRWQTLTQDHLSHTVGARVEANCLPSNFPEGQKDRQPHSPGLLAIG